MKTKRILSLLLALIMVLAVCPVITLSAADEAPVSAEDKWNGKVPFTAADEANWLTLIEAASSGETYTATKDDLKPYIDLDSGEIKNAEGLAIFSLLFADKMTTAEINGNFHGATYGKTFKLTADIDLNNQDWAPISNNGRTNWNAFTFDGQGHIISNMKIDVQSMADADALTFSFLGRSFAAYGLFGHINNQGAVKICNLALINSSVYVNNDSVKAGDETVVKKHNGSTDVYTGKNSVDVAAAGLAAFSHGGNQLTIDNVAVDCDVKVIASGAGNAMNGFKSHAAQCVAAGVLGIPYGGKLALSNIVYSGNVIGANAAVVLADGKTSSAMTFIGGIFVGQNNPGFQTAANLLSLSTTLLSYEICFDVAAGDKTLSTIPAPKNIYGYSTANGDANAWKTAGYWGTDLKDAEGNVTGYRQYAGMGKNISFADATTGAAATALVAEGWIQNDKAFAPVPAAFASNADVIAAAVSGYTSIGTAAELAAWNTEGYKTQTNIRLTADIDMSGYTWTPLPSFSGVIDGNGHKISNLVATCNGGTTFQNGNFVMGGGLIVDAGASTTICNLALVNATVTLKGVTHGGVLFGSRTGAATVSNVYVDADLIGLDLQGEKRFGAISGYNAPSSAQLTVNDCAFIVNFYGAVGSVYHYASGSTVVATNSYEITNRALGGWNFANAYASSSNIYSTGAISGGLGDNTVMSKYANADFIAAVNGKASNAGVVEYTDMLGNAMKLGDAWYTYADGTPVQKVFGATADAAKVLSYDAADAVVAAAVQIGTAEQLLEYVNNYNNGIQRDAILTADIVLNDTSDPNWYEKDGLVEWPMLTGFSNVFDGDGHTIEGLYFSKTLAVGNTSNYGFVDSNSAAMTIKNVGFINGRFEIYRNDALVGVELTTSDAGETYVPTYIYYHANWGRPAISYVGGIVGFAKADVTLDNVYNDIDLVISSGSNATGHGASIRSGGLAGFIGAGNFVVKNTQYVGTLFADIRTPVYALADYIGQTLVLNTVTTTEVEGSDPVTETTKTNVTFTEEMLAKVAEENRTFTQLGSIQWGTAWSCHWGANSIDFSDSLFICNIVSNGIVDGAFTQAGKDAGSAAYSFTNVYSNVWTRFNNDGVTQVSMADMVLYGQAIDGFTAVANSFPVLTKFADKVDTAAILSEMMFHNLGASLRTTEVGIRFSVELNQSVLGADNIVAFGMMVIPAKGLNGELTANTAGALNVMVPNEGILDADNAYANTNLWKYAASGSQMNVALMGVPEAAFDTEFVVRAYVILMNADDEMVFVYGDTMTRSINEVKNAVLNDANADQAKKDAVAEIYG